MKNAQTKSRRTAQWVAASGLILLLAWHSSLAAQPAGAMAPPGPMLSQAPVAAPRPVSTQPTRVGEEMNLIIGRSTLLRLPDPVERISIGNPAVADVTTISDRELYLIGKDLGSTNLIIWSRGGPTTVVDIKVGSDSSLLETELSTLLPGEKDIRVKTSADSIVLQGTVSDPVRAAQAVEIAQSWVRRLTRGLVLPITSGGDARGGQGTTIQVGETRNSQQLARVAGPAVINMLRVRAPMQVMLEVKVAEVSKTLLSRLGITTRLSRTNGDFTYDLLSQSNFFNQLLGAAAATKNIGNFMQLDAQSDDGLIKMLAEPNIMAISGQEASFRAGGKIFIPVARRDNVGGGSVVTLEEKEFGVGLKFKPIVLEGGRVHLQVAPEVSELQQTGTPFTNVGGITSILPSFTLRRAETTVQLNDGQSFMIAGLIQASSATTINRFPGLGDIPILGTLFRSTEFQNDRTELMFVVTPRLVKPLPTDFAMPTDGHSPPTPRELFIDGKLEGAAPAHTPSAAGGFQMK
jgi:pilus assembly protein CpaC